MNLVIINYSNWKAGRLLVLVGTFFLLPLAVLIYLPSLHGLTISRVFDFFMGMGFFGFGFLVFHIATSGSVSFAIAQKLLSKKPAIELSEKGIRSNVSGFTEKFIPLCDIDKATVTINNKGPNILHVRIKKEAMAKHSELTLTARWFKATPALRIFYELLEGSVEDVVDTINQYLEDANTAESSNDIVSSTLSDYVNKAA